MQITTDLSIEDLKAKWQWLFEQTRQISQHTEDHVMAYLAEQCQGKIVVEIGTYKGASAYMMCAAGAKLVHCIDPFFEPGTEEITRQHLKPFTDDAQAMIWVMRSGKAAEKINLPVEMIWVDDGHYQHEVEYDIDSWYPLLLPGGLICGHDLDPGSDVEKAVMNRLPGYSQPVPRLWAYIKP